MMPTQTGYRVLMKNRLFSLLVGGQLVSQLGDSIFRVALILWIVQSTDSPSSLGFITASFIIANLVGFAASGYVVDRFARRRIMIISDVTRTVLSFIVVLVTATIGFAGTIPTALLYGAFGLADAFFLPAYRATLPRVLAKSELYPANALDMAGRRIGLIIGPAVSALLLAFAGPAVTFAVPALTFAFSVLTIALCWKRLTERDAAYESPSVDDAGDVGASLKQRAAGFFREATGGVRFLYGVRWLGLLTLAAAVVNAGSAGAMDVVMPFFVTQNFDNGAALLGVVYSFQALGAVVGALVVGRLGSKHPGAAVAISLSVIGLSILAIPLGVGIWFVVIMGVIYGVAVETSGVHWSTILQTKVPDAVLGRVIAADYLISYSLMPLGVLACGFLLPVWGADRSFFIIGLVMAVFGAVPLLFSELRKASLDSE